MSADDVFTPNWEEGSIVREGGFVPYELKRQQEKAKGEMDDRLKSIQQTQPGEPERYPGIPRLRNTLLTDENRRRQKKGPVSGRMRKSLLTGDRGTQRREPGRVRTRKSLIGGNTATG